MLGIGLMYPPLFRFPPALLLVSSTSSLLVHPFFFECFRGRAFSWFPSGMLMLCGGRAENTVKGSVVSLKGAAFVLGQETSEVDATFEATFAALCGLAPWCRTLVWLAPRCFHNFFEPRIAGIACFFVGKESYACYQVGSSQRQRKVAEDTKPLVLRKPSLCCLSLK